MKNAVSNNR